MLNIELWWCQELTNESFALDVALHPKGPAIDLTQATAAQIRIWDEAGTVRYLAATIDSATATTARVRHTLGPSSFTAVGSWSCAVMFSFDAGTTWANASGAAPLTVR